MWGLSTTSAFKMADCCHLVDCCLFRVKICTAQLAYMDCLRQILIGHAMMLMQMLCDTLLKREAVLSTYTVHGEHKYLVCR